jgi:uncharacterized protein YjbI with pentapeptide repeats
MRWFQRLAKHFRLGLQSAYQVTGRALKRLNELVRCAEPWGIMLALIVFALAFIDRVEERTVRAWQLLTTPAPGNSGKGSALEYLNEEDGLLCWGGSCLITMKSQTPLRGIDLSPPDRTPDNSEDDPPGAYLRDVKLSGAFLREANLPDADLIGANLSGADLVAANLRGAKLSWPADLSGAILIEADLSGADLRKANLSDAKLSRAKLSGANLIGANLSDANLSDCVDRVCADLSGANLTDAILIRAMLSGADLSEADLSAANLSGATLIGANLFSADLTDACGDTSTKLPEGVTIKPCRE